LTFYRSTSAHQENLICKLKRLVFGWISSNSYCVFKYSKPYATKKVKKKMAKKMSNKVFLLTKLAIL